MKENDLHQTTATKATMKYVMFTNEKTGLRLPLFAADYVSHCDLQMGKGWVPTSAGFFSLAYQKIHGNSESLKLQPEKDDFDICLVVLGDMMSTIWLTQDATSNLERLKKIKKQRRQGLLLELGKITKPPPFQN
jgi:hypothetical protein